MFKKKASSKMTRGATLVAENTRVLGDVAFSDQLFVNGHIEGNVLADEESGATLVISDIGTVKGEINVPYVVINGRVEGDVHASVQVELAAEAKIAGNVYYKLIEMQLGALVEGQLVHVPEGRVEGASVHPLPSVAEEVGEG